MLRVLFFSACFVGHLLTTFGAHAEVMSLPVPVRTIYPKDVLRSEDFTFKDYEVNDIVRRTYLTSVPKGRQLSALRALPAGKPVNLKSLKPMADVRKGEQVVARYASGGIEILGVLVPEQDGVIGDVLRAKNPDTGVVLLALVSEGGTLVVGADQ
jgi:flagellar basal body P-ring formation protein FlgA